MNGMLRIASLTSLTMLAFAGNSLLCRVALRDTAIDAASFTSIRLISGALVLAGLMYARPGRAAAAGSWRAAALLFAYAAFFSFAYRQLSAATGALLLFGAVQTTMLGYGLLNGVRLGGAQLAGLAIAVAGLVYMLLPGLASPPLAGSLFMVGAGAAWGGYSLSGRGVLDPGCGHRGQFPSRRPFRARAEPPDDRTDQHRTAGGTLCNLVGRHRFRIGLCALVRRAAIARPVSAAIIQLSVPALAAAGGVVLLSEPVTLRLLFASVAILGGIALVVLGKRRV